MWRQTSIRNALSYLDGALDTTLYQQIHQATLRTTGDPVWAEATAWAAAIAAARAPESVPGPTLRYDDTRRLRASLPVLLLSSRISEVLATSGLVTAARGKRKPDHEGPGVTQIVTEATRCLLARRPERSAGA